MNINENIISWDVDYDWSFRGEEWSGPWGHSSAQWTNLIYPRIFRYLPTNNLLEISPGNGRWTNFLKNHTQKLVCVDLSLKCINHCKKRFKGEKNLIFHKNDGLKLQIIKDNSIDFVFSFDSLVHADFYILKSYLDEIRRVLKSDGIAFIHHSNLLNCKKGDGLREHVRAPDVNYKLVKNYAEKIGFKCMIQELINWRNSEDFLTDCFSTFIKSDSKNIDYKLFRNSKFMEHAQLIKEFSNYYK